MNERILALWDKLVENKQIIIRATGAIAGALIGTAVANAIANSQGAVLYIEEPADPIVIE